MAALGTGEDIAQVELHSLYLRDELHIPDLLLNDAEKHRAAAFRSSEARRLFVAGRVLCRSIIGPIAGCAPQALSIALTPSGRPYLPDYPGIDFNLSHTQDMVALAICRGGHVGIDIERLDAFSEAEAREIMPLILSEHELNQVHQLDARHRRDVFIACWVQKEAALKCSGQGFLADPHSVILASNDTTSSIECEVLGEPIFLRSGRIDEEETGNFQWAIATSRAAVRPRWQHHKIGISF